MTLKSWLSALRTQCVSRCRAAQRRRDVSPVCQVETAEPRVLLSVSALLINGTLNVSATGLDSITVRANATSGRVEVLDQNDISLRAVYIRSAENKIADFFSRLARPREYSLERVHFDLVQEWWGACTVDAFASGATAMLPRFWAELPTTAGRAWMPSPRCGEESACGRTLHPLSCHCWRSCCARNQRRRRLSAHPTGRARSGTRSSSS